MSIPPSLLLTECRVVLRGRPGRGPVAVRVVAPTAVLVVLVGEEPVLGLRVLREERQERLGEDVVQLAVQVLPGVLHERGRKVRG